MPRDLGGDRIEIRNAIRERHAGLMGQASGFEQIHSKLRWEPVGRIGGVNDHRPTPTTGDPYSRHHRGERATRVTVLSDHGSEDHDVSVSADGDLGDRATTATPTGVQAIAVVTRHHDMARTLWARHGSHGTLGAGFHRRASGAAPEGSQRASTWSPLFGLAQQLVPRSVAVSASPSRTKRESTRLFKAAIRVARMATVAVAFNSPWFAAVIAMLIAVVETALLGVLFPAVWSTRPTRRRAARAVLKELRRWFRRAR
jgi:hypothetical protein